MCAEGTFYYDYDESLEVLSAAVTEREGREGANDD